MASSNYSPAAREQLAAILGFSAALEPVTVANVAGSIAAGGTGMAAGGWDTAQHRDDSITTLTEIGTVVNNTLAALDSMGLPITVT